LPDSLAPVVDGLMTQGIAVIKATMESAAQPA